MAGSPDIVRRLSPGPAGSGVSPGRGDAQNVFAAPEGSASTGRAADQPSLCTISWAPPGGGRSDGPAGRRISCIAVSGTTQISVPHQLVVPRLEFCPVYCGFYFTLTGNFGFLSKIHVSEEFNGFGFKSFADKTSLNFQPGVTAIVGPNGCGKSNVSDAIRWVLGEQSAKALRGGEMADVIFNGTDARKPMGMAEVSLTIGGVDEDHLRAAGVEVAYNEVTVTRRIFRDGGSEYFINKDPVPAQGHPATFHGHGRGPHQLQHHGARPHHANSVQQTGRPPADFRGSRRHHQIQDPEKGVAPQTRIHRAKPAARGRPHPRSETADRLAPAPGRQGAPLQTASRWNSSISTRNSRGISSTCCRPKSTRSRPPRKNLRGEIETISADVLRCEDEIAQLRERLSRTGTRNRPTQQQRGLELKGEIDRHESRIQFNEERLRELAVAKRPGPQRHHPGRGTPPCRRRTNWQAVTRAAGRLGSRAEPQHRPDAATEAAGVAAVEDDLRATQEALRQAQAEAFAAAQDLTPRPQ